MKLEDILDKGKAIPLVEKRNVSEEYAEVVIAKKELKQWSDVLAAALGGPLKPEGAKPNQYAVMITKQYGGIRANQTLYARDFDDFTVVAMLWPWSDNVNITLKLGRFKK